MSRDSDDTRPGPSPRSPEDVPAVPPLKPFSAHGHHNHQGHHGIAPIGVRKPAPHIPPAPSRASSANPPAKTGTTPAHRANAANALGDEHASLHIARDVRLSGAITSCDKLMVDGEVEADLPRARVLVIGSRGRYAGRAHVEHADIAGQFEGDLTVTGRLSVRSTGRVTGTIAYGHIMVETGGQIAGESRVLPTAPKPDDSPA